MPRMPKSALNQFKSKDFWEEHRAVYFNTLYEKQTYEIIAVFKTAVYTDKSNLLLQGIKVHICGVDIVRALIYNK